MITNATTPAWLALLRKPYENIFGSRSTWDLALPDGSPMHVERIGQGLSNLSYRVRVGGQVFACKLFIADERRRAEREWAALSALQAAGLHLAPAPVAFAPDAPLPQPVIVSTLLEGDSLALQALTPAGAADLLQNLAAIHRVRPADGQDFLPAFHQPTGYGAYLDEARGFLCQVQDWAANLAGGTKDLPGWVADLPRLLPLCEEALRAAERTAAAAPDGGINRRPTLIRSDGNLDNVLRSAGGRLIFQNWEASGWGDAAYDLAELRWHPRAVLKLPAATWDAALATYPGLSDDPEFSTRLAVYTRLLPAWWVTRSALHLLEGAGQVKGQPRLARVPARFYRSVRAQLDRYLAALGLIDIADDEADDED